MYLEISARRSGKTIRLLQAINNHLDSSPTNTALIVCLSVQMEQEIRRELIEVQSRIIFLGSMHNSEKPLRGKPKEWLAGTRYFIDEFDLMDEDRLVIDPTAYYTGSPRKLRELDSDDLLMRLIRVNSNKVVSYTTFGHPTQARELKATISDEHYRTEILGQWLK